MKINTVVEFNVSIDTKKIASSSGSSHYPFYLLTNESNRTFIGENFIYNRPSTSEYYNIIGRYDDFFKALNAKAVFDKFSFIQSGNNYDVFVMYNCVFDSNGKVLLLLTFDDTSYLDLVDERDKDYTCKLFISTDFLLEEKYTNLWKKVEKEYVQKFYVEGQKVEYTTSEDIEKMCFSNSFNPVFNTLDDLSRHLREDVPSLFTEHLVQLRQIEEGRIAERQEEIRRQEAVALEEEINYELEDEEDFSSQDDDGTHYVAGVDLYDEDSTNSSFTLYAGGDSLSIFNAALQSYLVNTTSPLEYSTQTDDLPF